MTPLIDASAEVSMLGSVLLAPAELDEAAAAVRPDDFALPENRDLFRAILAVQANGNPLDVALVRSELIAAGRSAPQADALLMGAMSSVPYGCHAQHYAATVRDLARRRSAVSVGHALAGEAADPSADLDDLLARAEGQLHRVLEGAAEAVDLTLAIAIGEAMQSLDARQPAGLSTGLADLDALLGGLQPGSLTVVGARPSAGKTLLLVSLLRHAAASGTPGLLVSLEQSRREIVERILSSLAQVPSHVWRRQTDPTDDDRRRLDDAACDLAAWPLLIDDRPGQTMTQIRATVRLARRRHGVGLVCIDYLQLVEPDDKRTPREQQIAGMARSAKLLARELEIPVVLACQLNREVEKRADRRPQLSDLRESGAIEQDADVVLLVDPSKLDDRDPSGTLTLRVAKHRNGQRGDISVTVDRSTMTLRDSALEWQQSGTF